MSDAKLLKLCDFEWASTARYIMYISAIAGLKEINSSHVISFSLARLGVDKLIKQKKAVLVLLEGNKRKIERFVGEHKDDLDGNEIAVLRSIYVQYSSSEVTVREHIDFAEQCMAEFEVARLDLQVEEKDDLF